MPSLEVRSPYDLSLIETLETTPDDQVDAMLARASAALDKPLPKHERIAILERAIEKARAAKEEIAMLVAREGGKPLTDARVEAERGVQGMRNAIETLNSQAGEEIPMGITPSSANRLAFTTREPIGIVVAVSAFNHPFNLIVHQVIPAVAVGCPVIVKPASATPLSCLKLVGMLREAGLPEQWCQVGLLGKEAAESLVTDPRVSFFSFIGSSRVGWHLRSKLAPGARCALEHGGVAPVIVDEDADLASVVPPLVKGGYYHAGQVCVSVQRIFVHRNILESFSKAFTEATQRLKLGDPCLAETEVGPLILPRENDRIASWVDEAVSGGATLLCGGKKVGDTCYEPTVILEPPADSKVATEEIFGPVTCIFEYKDLDEAIARANALPVAFQAAVFSKKIDTALYAVKRLAAATVMVNDHSAFRVDWMPFAGHRQSGLGTGGIPHTMTDMTHEKLIVLKSDSL